MKYSKKVIEHFRKPHNQGTLKKADSISTVGNPVCGDIMRLYLKIGKNKKGEEIIKNVKFETLGCGAAIATSSMVTDMAKGKTLKQALKITKKDVTSELDWLPPVKQHCSNLAADALHEAVKKYLKEKKDKDKKKTCKSVKSKKKIKKK